MISLQIYHNKFTGNTYRHIRVTGKISKRKTEDTNPYYAKVDRYSGTHFPLPFYFEAREWETKNGTEVTGPGPMVGKVKFPKWVYGWVDRWSRPINAAK